MLRCSPGPSRPGLIEAGTASASGVPIKYIKSLVDSGRTFRVSEELIEWNLRAAEPYQAALPEGVRMGTWSLIKPGPKPGTVSATIRTRSGDVNIHAQASVVWNLRAGFLEDFGIIITNGPGERLGAERHVGSGIYHEASHAFLKKIDDFTFRALVDHAEKLRVLDMQLGTFLRIIGHQNWKNAPNVTLRERYHEIYIGHSCRYR